MIRAMALRLCMSVSVVVFGLSACAEEERTAHAGKPGNSSAVQKEKNISEPELVALISAANAAGMNANGAAGAELYADFCATCHQPKGDGVKDNFPALTKNVFVNGDAEEVIYLLLEGRAGMPTFIEDLSSKEMSDVINFIRTSWGNKATTVSEEEVEEPRAEIEEDDVGYSREG